MSINSLNNMFDLQEKLNIRTNGAEWKSGVAKNGKKINWFRCIYMEAAELNDSMPWKHWKAVDAEPDWANVYIELVDIAHFLWSEILRTSYEKNINNIYKHIVLSSYKEIKAIDKNNIEARETVIQTVESLINESTKSTPNINKILSLFFDTCALVDLSFADLYTKYIGKNVLNKFRQDNGYKEGAYIKNWNDIEDNVVMTNILNSNVNLSPDELYLELDKKYKILTAA